MADHYVLYGSYASYYTAKSRSYLRKKGVLHGLVCLHEHDLLCARDKALEETLRQLGEEVGFGPFKKGGFTHCGREDKKLATGEITVSMEAYFHNLKPIPMSRGHAQQKDSLLTPPEIQQF